jgi:hypothetical protein
MKFKRNILSNMVVGILLAGSIISSVQTANAETIISDPYSPCPAGLNFDIMCDSDPKVNSPADSTCALHYTRTFTVGGHTCGIIASVPNELPSIEVWIGFRTPVGGVSTVVPTVKNVKILP